MVEIPVVVLVSCVLWRMMDDRVAGLVMLSDGVTSVFGIRNVAGLDCKVSDENDAMGSDNEHYNY